MFGEHDCVCSGNVASQTGEVRMQFGGSSTSSGVDDEFELFRAQSYGVESVLRHQRAASVRATAKVKVIHNQVHREGYWNQ